MLKFWNSRTVKACTVSETSLEYNKLSCCQNETKNNFYLSKNVGLFKLKNNSSFLLYDLKWQKSRYICIDGLNTYAF